MSKHTENDEVQEFIELMDNMESKFKNSTKIYDDI